MDPTSTPTRMAGWLEQAWLTRYLDRELSEDERAWFEAYVLDKGDLLDVIEADSQLSSALSESTRRTAFGARRISTLGIRTSTWLAAAAVLAIGVCVGLVGASIRDQYRDQLIANPSRITYDSVRGHRITHSNTNENSAEWLLIEVAIPEGSKDAVLHTEGSPDLALQVSPEGFATFVVSRTLRRKQWITYFALDGSIQRIDL